MQLKKLHDENDDLVPHSENHQVSYYKNFLTIQILFFPPDFPSLPILTIKNSLSFARKYEQILLSAINFKYIFKVLHIRT